MRPTVTTSALIVTVSSLVPAILSIVIALPSEFTVKLALSASFIVPVAKVRVSCRVSNSAVVATVMLSPLAEVMVVSPSKLYKLLPKATVPVFVLPIFVAPDLTPAAAPSPAFPIVLLKVMVPDF